MNKEIKVTDNRSTIIGTGSPGKETDNRIGGGCQSKVTSA